MVNALVERGEAAVSLIAKMAELPRSDQHTLKDPDEIVQRAGEMVALHPL